MYALYLLFMVIYNAALIGSNTYKMCDQSPIYCLAENVVPLVHTVSQQCSPHGNALTGARRMMVVGGWGILKR